MYAIDLINYQFILAGEDKTKCILYSRDKNLGELKITCDNSKIKQYHMIEYLGCRLEWKTYSNEIS